MACECDDDYVKMEPLPWQTFFPDLIIPDGLTFSDLKKASELIQEWEDEGEWSGIPLVLKVYQQLCAADKRNRSTDVIGKRKRGNQGKSK